MTMTYPNGCYEVVIEFDKPQSHPNFGEGWGLGNFGNCKTYQGLQDVTLPGMNTYTGVVAYYDGKPALEVNA